MNMYIWDSNNWKIHNEIPLIYMYLWNSINWHVYFVTNIGGTTEYILSSIAQKSGGDVPRPPGIRSLPVADVCVIVTCGKNAYCGNLNWTFEDLLPCYCYVTKTFRNLCRQRSGFSELQAHHYMIREQWT